MRRTPNTWQNRLMIACTVILLGMPLAALIYGWAVLNVPAQTQYKIGIVCSIASWVLGVVLVFLHVIWPLNQLRRALSGTKGFTGVRSDADPSMIELRRLIATIECQYEQEYQLEMLKKEAELNALQSQINPHFLYNTLDSIRGRLIGEGLREESQIVESLSNLFRYSISPKAVYNTLDQELENVENYMRIMRYRFGDRLRFIREIDESVPYIRHCELPKLTLQPIVENAILHGMEKRSDGGTITIRASITEAGLSICVEDNGVGMEPEVLDRLAIKFREGAPVQQPSGGGIALVNVHERIRMRYGENYGVAVYSDVGLGTQVNLLLPVMMMPEQTPDGRRG